MSFGDDTLAPETAEEAELRTLRAERNALLALLGVQSVPDAETEIADLYEAAMKRDELLDEVRLIRKEAERTDRFSPDIVAEVTRMLSDVIDGDESR